jgi:uncharacterized protein (TIGR02145 family)
MKHSYHFLMIIFIIGFTTNLYSQSVPSYVPTNGLVGWWGFNGNAQDNSGNGNHGIVNGATLTTDRFGNQNGAYSFDGVDDYIQIESTNGLNSISGISMSIWFNWNGPNGVNNHQYFFLIANNPNGSIVVTDAGILGINVINCNCANDIAIQTNITSNTWYNVILTYDLSQGLMKMYLNGILINVTQENIYNYYTTNNPIDRFGNYHFNSHYFNGKLDEAGLWNRALTQQEITNLYNSQLPTQTSLCLPSITTNTPTSIGIDSVIVGGNIMNDGGSSIVLRGVCYSTTPNPNMGNMRTEDGSGVGSFSTILRNLNPSTTYYVRSYAKNSNGVVVYGDEVSFGTYTSNGFSSCGGVTDVDGNSYQTVQIGTQCWMQSNLKVSRYRNGDSIPTGLSDSAWVITTTGAYSIYDNNTVNDGLYGKLYNHYAVMDIRGLCPTGWHVPTDSEWNVMVRFLDPNADTVNANEDQSPLVGGMLMSTSCGGATNSTGFTAELGGFRGSLNDGGVYRGVGSICRLWSSSIDGPFAWSRILDCRPPIRILRHTNYPRTFDYSVRCLRD